MYPNPGHAQVGLIPIVTSSPVSRAAATAVRSVAWNASRSWIKWSAGSTIIVAPESRSDTQPAPSAIAAAVSRLAGSATMFSGGSPGASARTADSCSWLVRIST